MGQRLGALLCLALGSVLIWSGLSSDATGAVGQLAPQCGQNLNVGVNPQTNCPTGVINFTEVTDAGTATPPGTWVITLTGNCLDPNTGLAVNQQIQVDDGTSQGSGDLYVFTDFSGTTKCQYTYVETPVAPFTTTYKPNPPASITFNGTQNGSTLAVTVTNTGPSPSSSSPTHGPTPTHSRTPTHSASSSPVSTSIAPTPSSSSAPQLAVTGPRSSVRPSLYLGIGLCLLGVVLLFLGKPSRQHS